MTEADVKRLLEEVRNYSVIINSLKLELEQHKGNDLESIIKTDLDKNTEHIMKVRACIFQISDNNVKNVMRMRYINNFSFTNIARKLNVTYQWVFQLHKRGITELANLIK